MDYSGSIAAYQQELARSHDMTARRVRVLQALALTPGEHVLEVGCGGGMLLRELGIAVGPTGMAHGIDLSGDQVAAARDCCIELAHVSVEVGDARWITSAAQTYDATVSTQVLECLADVELALGELHRVTRPGGRFLNVTTN